MNLKNIFKRMRQALPHTRSNDQVEPDEPMYTLEELQQACEDANANGFDRGLIEGYNVGKADGLEEAKEAALKALTKEL